MSIKQLLSFALLLLLSTTAVNAHALSHLFDGDTSNIEHCQTCDEFTTSTSEELSYTTPEFITYHHIINVDEIKVKSITDISISVVCISVGQYFNKPPPSL